MDTNDIIFTRYGKRVGVGVEEAFEKHLEIYTQRYEGRGIVERTDDKVDALAKVVSTLVKFMLEKHIIDLPQLEELLGYDFNAVHIDDTNLERNR